MKSHLYYEAEVYRRRAARLSVFAFLLAASFLSNAQSLRNISGKVSDASNGEPVPFANIVVEGTSIGTISNLDGTFSLTCSQRQGKLTVSFIGYKDSWVDLASIKGDTVVGIELQPTTYSLQAVSITASKKRGRYKRKDNPAVELMDSVIAHKHEGRPKSAPYYKADCYKRLTLALDRFDFKFDSMKYLSDLKFLQKYVDTSLSNGQPVLPISLRETKSTKYYSRQLNEEKEIFSARNMQGVDMVLDKEGLSTNLDRLFQDADIFDNDMEFLLTSFVSPLSSTMATMFYHYYLQDTVEVDGVRCVEVGFAPAQKSTVGFGGQLFITLDGCYQLKKYVLRMPKLINLNYVKDIVVEQTFADVGNGVYAAKQNDTYVNFYLSEGLRQIYAHQTRIYGNYDFSPIADSVFAIPDTANASLLKSKSYWENERMIPLSSKEELMDSIVAEVRRVPKFDRIINLGNVVVSGYCCANGDRSTSYFDFGPIYTMVSHNTLEGLRLRLGGMTTANLNKHWFANGYMAYGFGDKRAKYHAQGMYSFNAKEYHPFESLRNNLCLTADYDVVVPGAQYTAFERDNIFMSIPSGSPTSYYQYTGTAKLSYEKEWANRMSLGGWIQYQHNEAAGSLQYILLGQNGTCQDVGSFSTMEAGVKLRYAPGEPFNNNRLGKESLFNLAHDAPMVSMQWTMGMMNGETPYGKVEMEARKRFWLSQFGYIDASLSTGKIFGRLPYPLLYLPNASQSYFVQDNAYALMLPLEFIGDGYIALHSTYHLKGLILNHIPFVNRLKLREVVSFRGLYGALSAQNNPSLNPVGIYQLPSGSHALGSTPYMEMGFGLENILRFLRVDYVVRLNYLDQPNAPRSGVRFAFKIEF